MESACDVFYGVYKNGGRSDIVKELVQQLDFHALSITLLATTAAHNAWDHDRLAKEWGTHRAQVLRTDYNESLGATIELSLASPTFRKLGPNARELLGVVAFFPQGIDENNLDWLFPTISDRMGIFDKFCALSLTYRSNSFIGMLAPLRDYLGPRDPSKSPLLCTTKDRYISRLQLLGDLEPDQPGFRDSRWIRSEDVNTEHLLYVFTSFDTGSDNIWDACANFIAHLYRHKPRSTVLRPKVEGLSDDHHSKLQCLYQLSVLLELLGNHVERKQLLLHLLELERGRRNDGHVVRALRALADTNRWLFLYEEGIQQSREALEIAERLGDAEGQAKSWICFAWLLFDNDQFEAAEEAGSKAMNLFLDQGREYWVCGCHRLLGLVYNYKGERGKAIQHSEAAIRIASPFDWHEQLCWAHFALAQLFENKNEFDNAQSHIEEAKLHAVDNTYSLGRAMEQQSIIWRRQGRLEEAKVEALRALEAFEKLGVTGELGTCRGLLQKIELDLESQSISGD
jgi:tetratricopeptide (TPR) repeat protein